MFATILLGSLSLLAEASAADWLMIVIPIVAIILVLWLMPRLLGIRYIPHDQVGIVEKLWSSKGSLGDGRIIALNGEAGYQADVLRGGLHFRKFGWQYRVHRLPLVSVPQGKIAYVYARDGGALSAGQTLARVAACNNFQDARAFLKDDAGQRGRQRMILREGMYAINLALFVVITEECVYHLPMKGEEELHTLVHWQEQLKALRGFSPVVVGANMQVDPKGDDDSEVDSIGIATVHDGPSLEPGEIIAPSVGATAEDPCYHNFYQDPEAFLRGGGRRGRQYVPLTDGTYFINRWFATVELMPKTIVPIGYVGVVISYYGPIGKDLSGDQFRHGERVARGERGVWERPLGPGKYPFNTYAGMIVLVPTTNFVLHWVTGRTEAHKYDESLRSIDLVTKDAYEPMLPLSVVVHIDYMKAPSVIQRFGDVKKLITQTLDPMLSAYFRDVAHKRTMLELLQHRDEIQKEAREALRQRFLEFDIECVDVLIGKPDTAEAGGKIETLLEQLRVRQLAREQVETYEHQGAAAEKLRVLNEKQALANKQAELTNSVVQIRIAENAGDADLARARKQAEQTVVTAQADSQSRILAGQGESQRLMQVGLSEAAVLLKKVRSYGDPRLYALSLVAEQLAHSAQPLVPERLFMTGGDGATSANGSPGQGIVGTLLGLLLAEKSGFAVNGDGKDDGLNDLADRVTKEVMATMQPALAPAPVAAR